MSDDDFPLPVAQDEWTWIDDLMFGVRVTLIIVAVLTAAGLVVWRFV